MLWKSALKSCKSWLNARPIPRCCPQTTRYLLSLFVWLIHCLQQVYHVCEHSETAWILIHLQCLCCNCHQIKSWCFAEGENDVLSSALQTSVLWFLCPCLPGKLMWRLFQCLLLRYLVLHDDFVCLRFKKFQEECVEKDLAFGRILGREIYFLNHQKTFMK